MLFSLTSADDSCEQIYYFAQFKEAVSNHKQQLFSI